MRLKSVVRAFFFLCIASVFILEFPGVKDLIDSPYSGIETKNLVVQNIDDSGPNRSKNIGFGDEIHSIDGEAVRNYNHYRRILIENARYAPQTYVLLRGPEKIEVEIDYIEVPPRVIQKKFKFLLVAFTFLLMGLLVYLRRSDRLGVLFSVNCTILAFFLTDRPTVSAPFLQLFGELFHDAIILLFPAVFLHFFLIFPDRQPTDDSVLERRSIWKVYVPPLALYCLDCYLVLRHFFYASAERALVAIVLYGSMAIMVGYLVASLVIFARNYRASPRAQKVRLRIVIGGTIAGTIPFLFTVVLRQISPGASNWWDYFSAVALGFIVVSFAYAILKHGAIELNLVVKKSLVYAILTGGIIAVYYALVNILGDFFTREFNLSRSIFSVLSVLVIAVVFAPARSFFQRLLDRVFYVGEYVFKQEIVEFNKHLSGKLSRKEIFDYLYEKVAKLLKASYMAVYLKSEDDILRLRASYGEASSLPREISKQNHLINSVMRLDKSLLIEYLDRPWQLKYLDEASRGFLDASRAAVILRLATHGTFLGLIVLGEKRASFDILGKMMSSSEVGGDYFDYFTLDEDRVAIVLGDVSGNGIPAAMLVFSIQAVFKNLAVKERLSPGDMNRDLNNYLCSNAKPGQFATFFYGILDVRRFTFTFSNAGQHPVLLIKGQYVDRLGEGGVLLGVQKNHVYQEGSVRIEPGDLLCLHTDGIVEQKNAAGEEYGEKRLVELLRKAKDLPLPAITESLFASVLSFGSGVQDDDLSCIIVRRRMS
ncbi:MAG: SpoIIE family protein phosphatase [Chitinivibrionia bacterium]|nr:SpoIIE family protein phosphatase [Chitinivibrionia bacterium]